MNKNSPISPLPGGTRPPLQFTELTIEDVILNEDLSIQLLLQDKSIPLGEKGECFI